MRQPVGRMSAFGTTIFAEMSALASRFDAINLGQGFPDSDGPPDIAESARAAILDGHNQYAPGSGVQPLRESIARHQDRYYGIVLDPDTEILVTTGATEAITAAVLAYAGPGDEVVVLEPYYDSYVAAIALSGATRRSVPLRGDGACLDLDELAAAITPWTTAIIVNTPHNPTGTVLGLDALSGIADLCERHDLVAISDEVYEHLTFDTRHIPLATVAGMFDRTITVSSAGKTYSFTGWKIGWATGPSHLIDEVRRVKQFLTFVSGTPFQYAVAEALDHHDEWIATNRDVLRSRRDRLVGGLRSVGFGARPPDGTYFAVADISPVTDLDGDTFCRRLPRDAGVAAVPLQVFCDDPAMGRTRVRFAFCKDETVLDEAVDRLVRWGRSSR